MFYLGCSDGEINCTICALAFHGIFMIMFSTAHVTEP